MERIRKLCKYLKTQLSPNDIAYVKSVLGMSFDEVLNKDPVGLFLILLEVYVGYLHHIVMLYDLVELFKRIGKITSHQGIELVFDLGNKYIKVGEYVAEEHMAEIRDLYFKLFASDYGLSVLRELIDKVRDPRLADRFRRFFLVKPSKGYD